MDNDLLDDLEALLFSADLGVQTAEGLLQTVRMLGLQPFDASHLKPLLAAAGAAGAVTLVHRLPGVGTSSLAWIPLLAAYVAVYAGLLRGMGFEDEDRALLQAVLRRRKQNAG